MSRTREAFFATAPADLSGLFTALDMPKSPNSQVMLAYESLMRERDRIRAEMPQCPPTVEQHVGIAIFEAWTDRLVDDAHVLKQIAKFHAKPADCTVCSENLNYYHAQRYDKSREDE